MLISNQNKNNFMIPFLCETYFKLAGWKIKGLIPDNIKQCVVIAAPHTSNFDFPLTIGFFNMMKKPIRYLGKKELFSFPLGMIMRSTGGIAVDRSKNNNLVEYIDKNINNVNSLKGVKIITETGDEKETDIN